MICSSCQYDLPASCFAFRNRTTGLRHKKCRDCVRACSASHYRANKPACLVRGAANSRSKRREPAARILTYFQMHPCMDCGETDPVVLDFDHRDGTLKTATISLMLPPCYSWKKLQDEMDKCDIRCANCHRKRQQSNLAGAVFF